MTRWRAVPRWIRQTLFALLMLASCVDRADAHPALPTVAIVNVAADGVLTVTLIHDALAYALNDTSARVSDADMLALLRGPEQDLTDAMADAYERLVSGMELAADDRSVVLRIEEAPNIEAIRRWKHEFPSLPLPLKMECVLSASMPAGASRITLRFPAVLSDVLLVIDRPGIEPITLPLAPAERSPAIPIRATPIAGASPAAVNGASAPVAPSFLAVAWRYARLGFLHIVPWGVDHALFVLGLFVLTPRIKAVLWQVTAFTLAHTLTLSLATLHLLSISSRIVEPAIALSIACVAVENLFARKVHPWRPFVAFAFGLVHGLGFASGLMEVGLPTGQLAAGIIAFNVGVEVGHLTILLLATVCIARWRDKLWYRRRIVLPISVAIGLVALVWFLQRL